MTRVSWKQSTRLEIGFYAKGAGKSQIAVQVSRPARKGDVEPVRHVWKAALAKLQRISGGPAQPRPPAPRSY